MRDQQLERELEALDRAFERFSETLDFSGIRLGELIPRWLRDCLTRGVSLAAVVLRREPSVRRAAGDRSGDEEHGPAMASPHRLRLR